MKFKRKDVANLVKEVKGSHGAIGKDGPIISTTHSTIFNDLLEVKIFKDLDDALGRRATSMRGMQWRGRSSPSATLVIKRNII